MTKFEKRRVFLIIITGVIAYTCGLLLPKILPYEQYGYLSLILAAVCGGIAGGIMFKLSIR